MEQSFSGETSGRVTRRSCVRTFIVVLVCLAGLVAPTSAVASLEVPVSVTDSGGTFIGVFSATSFGVSDVTGRLQANGTLSGTLYNPIGELSGTISSQSTSLIVFSVAATCQSLNVGLEPTPISVLGNLFVFGGGNGLNASTTSKTPTLCKVSRLIAKNASNAQIAAALNKYLSKNDP